MLWSGKQILFVHYLLGLAGTTCIVMHEATFAHCCFQPCICVGIFACGLQQHPTDRIYQTNVSTDELWFVTCHGRMQHAPLAWTVHTIRQDIASLRFDPDNAEQLYWFNKSLMQT